MREQAPALCTARTPMQYNKCSGGVSPDPRRKAVQENGRHLNLNPCSCKCQCHSTRGVRPRLPKRSLHNRRCVHAT